jgi:hypothetical protein
MVLREYWEAMTVAFSPASGTTSYICTYSNYVLTVRSINQVPSRSRAKTPTLRQKLNEGKRLRPDNDASHGGSVILFYSIYYHQSSLLLCTYPYSILSITQDLVSEVSELASFR